MHNLMFSRKTETYFAACLQNGHISGQGWKFIKKVKMEVLRTGLPIVEHLSGLQEIMFSLLRRHQLHFGNKNIIYTVMVVFVKSREELNSWDAFMQYFLEANA